ncbi:Uncharacterized protein dnm_040620 [Desulfonema magnum]|uniref:Uncharacterized protein n=1 Tax=Desulfonema magnum TaxID=45655 RepID=A0A975BMK2_9BACT|nr:Uncharacterized protein dnm_040620 [Desulfonema magnum]
MCGEKFDPDVRKNCKKACGFASVSSLSEKSKIQPIFFLTKNKIIVI